MRYLFTVCLLGAFPLLPGVQMTLAEELRPSFLMLSDPEFAAVPPLDDRLPDRIVELWRTSLQRSEAFYRQSAAIDIRNAHRAGFDEVKAAIPELRQLLREKNAGLKVHTAVVQALIELDARTAAEEIFEISRESTSQFRQLAEPALAEWNYQPIRQVWKDRFKADSTPRRELILACEGSGRVRDEQALADLLAIVHDPARPRDIRLSAARAAGEIADRGLDSDVRKLLSRNAPPLIRRLCAVALLTRHDSDQARKLLQDLFEDPAGPVAAAAIERLLTIDPKLVLELSPQAWDHPDIKVRRAAADCLIALPTPARVQILARHLHDPSPALRSHIAMKLLEFTQRPDLETEVRESVVEVLHSDDWRGQEQACLLLGQLDQEEVASRLLELLPSNRPEVQIASAWALKKLKVKEVLTAMLDQAQRQTDNPQGEDLTAVDRQVAHLFEAMAIMNYRAAIPLMRRHIPKDITHRRLCRGAAVWALGHLQADENDRELAAELMGRVKDLGLGGVVDPEIEIVRRMSAISLGRMKATSQLPALKELAGEEVGHQPIEASLKWAIHEMDGEDVPYRQQSLRVLRGWRIQPAELK